ncbi:hypothetical protein K2V75_03830 [Staphylococcus gallinarum]|uniref:hypothetical protein n=1 Tax=Staphylococcus gallinarum TaxID=1293 RepID=UPI001E38862B|nr:hypothetical protein [Staphylococcus gallinarum]MCD8909262.1 hypothetical protein [Staphylococcus gallinarum]
MKEKVKINIKGQKKYLYSTRQITQIIDAISEKHYKNEVLREIVYSDDIRNVIVLDESAKVNQKYNDINEDNFQIDSSNLLQIYHKGLPYSLMIDKKIMLMNTTFKIFKELYQHSSEKNNKMSMETKKYLLFELYKILTSEEYSESSINEFLKQNSTYGDKKIKSIKNQIERTRTLFDKYEVYNSLDSKKKEEDDKYKDVRRIEKDFFKNFYSLSKPIIYIQLEDNSWKMLGVRMIKEKYFKHSNPKFVDINKVEQNSPLIIVLAVSSPFIPVLIKLSKSLCEASKKKKNQNKNLQEFEEIIQLTEEQYENPDLTLQEIKKIENELIEKIDELPESLQLKVKEIKEKLTENNISSLIENNLFIDKIDISEQDSRNH